MTRANPARGETEVEIGGETYVLAGTFENVARFQGAVAKIFPEAQTVGISTLLLFISLRDARVLLEGIRTLAISGDLKKLDHAPFYLAVDQVRDAIRLAIAGPQVPDENPTEATENLNLN
jgi:hypothetical protein